MIEQSPLLKETLRMTALMIVPIVAFLAILSAVALFAVPTSSPASKEQRVFVPGADNASPTDKEAAPVRGGSRATAKPQNKI